MKHAKESGGAADFFYKLYLSYIPNKRDNVKQIIVKIFFLLSLAVLIVSASYLTNYFLCGKKQESIIEKSRTAWHNAVSAENDTESAVEIMTESNSDFKGWITVPGTKIDNPFFQSSDNEFYLTHNQDKQKSTYGALFLDCSNTLTAQKRDKNLVIYGHHMKNGSMFANLTKYKSLSFYKQNPIVRFSTVYGESTYKIYAAFVLNASKADDNGYVYNIYRNKYSDEEDFDSWYSEAKKRSIINTGVDVSYGDNIITLVTCDYDFENARFVVMARETRSGENETVDTSKASTNASPRYPKRWYDERGLEYPYD